MQCFWLSNEPCIDWLLYIDRCTWYTYKNIFNNQRTVTQESRFPRLPGCCCQLPHQASDVAQCNWGWADPVPEQIDQDPWWIAKESRQFWCHLPARIYISWSHTSTCVKNWFTIWMGLLYFNLYLMSWLTAHVQLRCVTCWPWSRMGTNLTQISKIFSPEPIWND